MKIVLSSFGISDNRIENIDNSLMYYRMPPASIGDQNAALIPNYALLLLCEKVIVDEKSFYLLMEKRHPIFSSVAETLRIMFDEGFVELADFHKILESNKPLLTKMLDTDLKAYDLWIDVFKESVEIWDEYTRSQISSIANLVLQYNQQKLTVMEEDKSLSSKIADVEKDKEEDTIKSDEIFSKSAMVQNIISLAYLNRSISVDLVRKILSDESLDVKEINKLRFVKIKPREGQYVGLHDEMYNIYDIRGKSKIHPARVALSSPKKRLKPKYRSALKSALKWFLSHANSNIIISNELNAGFHDWETMSPFYNQKFMFVGQDGHETSRQLTKSEQLFKIAFPEFAISSPSELMKILTDKRISELRSLVHDAAQGDVSFDNEFAKQILKEVLGTEQKITKYRNIISYLTLPLDFLPGVGTFAQLAVEEGIGAIVENKLRKKHRWFYMFSELNKNK
jgi:hypothetical protein